jgi:putative FmdB family regulatory protein
MPFYEYECRACGAQAEVLQKISDPPLKKCPECGKAKLHKLISAPVFRLKGGGWYETDFKSDKENKRNLVETEKAEAKPAEGEGKSEKPADKAEKPADKSAATESKSAPKPDKPAARPVAAPKRRPAAKKSPRRSARR